MADTSPPKGASPGSQAGAPPASVIGQTFQGKTITATETVNGRTTYYSGTTPIATSGGNQPGATFAPPRPGGPTISQTYGIPAGATVKVAGPSGPESIRADRPAGPLPSQTATVEVSRESVGTVPPKSVTIPVSVGFAAKLAQASTEEIKASTISPVAVNAIPVRVLPSGQMISERGRVEQINAFFRTPRTSEEVRLANKYGVISMTPEEQKGLTPVGIANAPEMIAAAAKQGKAYYDFQKAKEFNFPRFLEKTTEKTLIVGVSQAGILGVSSVNPVAGGVIEVGLAGIGASMVGTEIGTFIKEPTGQHFEDVASTALTFGLSGAFSKEAPTVKVEAPKFKETIFGAREGAIKGEGTSITFASSDKGVVEAAAQWGRLGISTIEQPEVITRSTFEYKTGAKDIVGGDLKVTLDNLARQTGREINPTQPTGISYKIEAPSGTILGKGEGAVFTQGPAGKGVVFVSASDIGGRVVEGSGILKATPAEPRSTPFFQATSAENIRGITTSPERIPFSGTIQTGTRMDVRFEPVKSTALVPSSGGLGTAQSQFAEMKDIGGGIAQGAVTSIMERGTAKGVTLTAPSRMGTIQTISAPSKQEQRPVIFSVSEPTQSYSLAPLQSQKSVTIGKIQSSERAPAMVVSPAISQRLVLNTATTPTQTFMTAIQSPTQTQVPAVPGTPTFSFPPAIPNIPNSLVPGMPAFGGLSFQLPQHGGSFNQPSRKLKGEYVPTLIGESFLKPIKKAPKGYIASGIDIRASVGLKKGKSII